MNKRIIILSGIAVVAMGTISIVNASSHSVSPQPVKSATVNTVSTQTKPAITENTPVDTQTTASDAQTPVITPTQPTDPKVVAYGEDTNNPGTFIVFDKATVMTQAGIAADQQDFANQLISKLSNWRYEVINVPQVNLCNVYPAQKMASMGGDYLVNPITQLKWCNAYYMTNFGDWQSALTKS